MRSRTHSAGARVDRRAVRGVAYLELLISVVLVLIAALGAISTWGFSTQVPVTKRVTEMGVFIGVSELERLKSMKYGSLEDGTFVSYYDRHGAPVSSASNQGYKAKSTVSAIIDRDSSKNTEDLREIKIEVWDNNETVSAPYETVRTLLSFGGN